MMPDATTLLAFAGLCAILAITPGPDTFLVLRYGHTGVAPGLSATAGSALGSLIWAGAVAAGVSSVITERPWAMATLQVAGGLYLLYLGIVGIIITWRTRGLQADGLGRSRASDSLAGAFRAGIGSCLLNPKVGLFFLAVVPQFLSPQHMALLSVMLLGLIDAVVATVWLALLTVASTRATQWLQRPSVSIGLGVTSSGALATLGIGTIASVAS